MKTPKTIGDKIAYRIASSKGEVFMRKDFNDIADYDQVGCSLRQLLVKSKIVKIGYGLYAKAGVSPLSNRIVPPRGLRDLATEALKKLKVEVVPSS
jgi:hypothetical protein